MFLNVLFRIVKNQKSSQYPSVEEWLHKLWYINKTEFNTAIKHTSSDKGEQLTWKNVKKKNCFHYITFSVKLLPLRKRMLFQFVNGNVTWVRAKSLLKLRKNKLLFHPWQWVFPPIIEQAMDLTWPVFSHSDYCPSTLSSYKWCQDRC